MGFLDLHSHVLPGLDDGARDLATSRAMIAGLGALGFTDIYATPHQKFGSLFPSLAAIDAAYATAGASLPNNPGSALDLKAFGSGFSASRKRAKLLSIW